MPNDPIKYPKGKIPPHSLEAERGVLASAIIDPYVFDELLGFITAEEFYQPAHQVIFEALLALHKNGKPLDLTTLITRLQDEDNLEKAGGIDYISELTRFLPNSANVESYIKIIHEKATLRDVVVAGADISALGYNNIDPVEDIVDKAQAIAYELGTDVSKTELMPFSEIMSTTYNKLDKLFNQGTKSTISGVATGYTKLDEMTNGFQKSDLIIIAGRPGMGKTSFGLNILYRAATAGKCCAFFSLEMSSEQLAHRIISSEQKISISQLRTGTFNHNVWESLGQFTANSEKLEMYFDDTASITINQIRSKCRKLQAKTKGRLDIIFIDYLQIMGVNKSITVREQQVSENSRALKALAKEFNVPVIAFAQVNRGVDNRTDSRPMLSDLRESGAIEQDADIIIFLYRKMDYKKKTPQDNSANIAEIIIAKHRNGSTGTVHIEFDPNFTYFKPGALDETYIKMMQDEEKNKKRREKQDE